MPRVSVIIPTYNRASLISEAIQSVLDQTYADWELIVVDDGSTDETAQVVAEFGERVRYIYQYNAGVCAARNVGFTASRGEFVTFLDSDDRMLPKNLEVLVALMDAMPNVNVTYGWYYWLKEDGQLSELRCPTMQGQILPQLVLQEALVIGTTLIQRACVEMISGFDEAVHYQEHWDFYLRLARAGCSFACCRQPVAILRFHPKNRGKDREAMLAWRLTVLDRLFSDLEPESNLVSIHQQAYYRAYIDFALEHYAKGDLERGALCLNRGLDYALLKSADLESIAVKMGHYALAPDTEYPYEFVRELFVPLRSTIQVSRLRRKVLGIVNMAFAFRCYRSGDLNQIWRYSLRAISNDPSLLFNRGLARITFKGLVGTN